MPDANNTPPLTNSAEMPNGTTAAPNASGTATEQLLLSTERKPTASPPRPAGDAACNRDNMFGWLMPTAHPNSRPNAINAGATPAQGRAINTTVTTASDARK